MSGKTTGSLDYPQHYCQFIFIQQMLLHMRVSVTNTGKQCWAGQARPESLRSIQKMDHKIITNCSKSEAVFIHRFLSSNVRAINKK